MEALQRAKLVVGIPAFNEENSIADMVAGALIHAATVVVVDDGSTDLTAFRASRAGAIVIRFRYNHGKGSAVATLFEYAREHGADVLVMLDGDGQHDPAEIPAVAAPCLRDEADLVVGSRYLTVKSDIPLHRSWGQRAFNLMTAVASGVRCSDSQSGFRAFGRRALCSMRLTETSFSVECEQQFECQVHGLRLAEVPISCSYAVPPKRNVLMHGSGVLYRLGVTWLRRRVLLMTPATATLPPIVNLSQTAPVQEVEPNAALVGD